MNKLNEKTDVVSALDRGFIVLRCFSEEKPLLGHSEIALITGIPRPTVNRLVSTLLSLGMLRHSKVDDKYMLGPGIVSLARVYLSSLDIRSIARDFMQNISEQIGASVYLAVRDGMEMVLVEACRPRSSILSARLDVGSRAPLETSALGRAYLACAEKDERDKLIESLQLLRGNEWGNVSKNLFFEMDRAASEGYCLSIGDFHKEINSLSVPFVSPQGEIMALNAGGAAYIFKEEILVEKVAPKLLEVANRIAKEIGGYLPSCNKK